MNALSQNRDKEKNSDKSNFIVSVNGSQVWIDNKFDDELLEDIRMNATVEKNATGDNEELNPM